jgi:heme oxygenase
MIGKRLSDSLLEGKTLAFYEWDGDVKVMLESVRKNIDTLAETWSGEEKQQCMEETMACFRYGGGLIKYMKEPQA